MTKRFFSRNSPARFVYLAGVAGMLALGTATDAYGQTRVYADTGINLVATGPSSSDTGSSAFASSSVSADSSSATASASAAGTASASASSANGTLSANAGADAGYSYTFQINNLYGHSLSLNASLSVTAGISVSEPVILSTIPQAVSTPLFAYSLITNGTPGQLTGNHQEEWQNGALIGESDVGTSNVSTTWNITPQVGVSANLFSLSQGDLNYLSISVPLDGQSLANMLQFNLSGLAGLIETRIFELGLPSHDILPGVSVDLGLETDSNSVANLSSEVAFQGNDAVLVRLGVSTVTNSGGGGTSSSTSITAQVSGFSLAPDDVSSILADPDFQFDPNGNLMVENPSGAFEPVLVSSGDATNPQTFNVTVPEPGPGLYVVLGFALLLAGSRKVPFIEGRQFRIRSRGR